MATQLVLTGPQNAFFFSEILVMQLTSQDLDYLE